MAEKKTAFYCQLDYEHVPYPSPVGAKNGNIANNGCGVCAASMVAENMLGVSFPPEEAAQFGVGHPGCGQHLVGRVGGKARAPVCLAEPAAVDEFQEAQLQLVGEKTRDSCRVPTGVVMTVSWRLPSRVTLISTVASRFVWKGQKPWR